MSLAYHRSSSHFPTTVTGQQTLQQAASDTEGIDPKMITNVGTAARLWRSAYGPKGRFGKSTNMAGGWIGGGGNYGSECRCMCATFIVVVHVLQWLWECGHSEGLSEAQCDEAGRNLAICAPQRDAAVTE
jgi:hypothetical protein